MITVGISDMNVGRDDDSLITYALGSCVGICLYCAKLKIGALGHIMLPLAPPSGADKVDKYADTCIAHMLQKLQSMQCPKSALTAKIAGGAKMFEVTGDTAFGNIGARNVEAVKSTLKQYGIPIVAEDTGDNFGRTVCFHLTKGEVEVKSFSRPTKIL